MAPTTTDIVTASANVGAEYQLTAAELQDYVPTDHTELGEMLPSVDMDTLSQVIEKDR